MWIIRNLNNNEVAHFETVEEWHEFVDENGWTYYSVQYKQINLIDNQYPRD